MPIGENIKHTGRGYPSGYKDDLFRIWFKHGKPSAQKLWEMIPDEWEVEKPTLQTVTIWIREIYRPRSELLDERLNQELEERLVKEKVEMLYRHAKVGRLMQNKALEHLNGVDPADLSTSSSVRLLVEGLRIERDSVGIPQAVEKLLNETDEDLLNRVQNILGDSPAEILEG